jgi:hypothetical protein
VTHVFVDHPLIEHAAQRRRVAEQQRSNGGSDQDGPGKGHKSNYNRLPYRPVLKALS